MTETASKDNLVQALSDAQSAGQWMSWTGWICALCWWGAGAGGLLALIGWQALISQPAAIIIAAAVLIFVPGLLMAMSGLMAQQSLRTQRANEIILKASATLLAPADTASTGIASVAEATRVNVELVNRTVSEALAALKKTTDMVENERLRAESVSYAMADNTRDLTQRLTEERIAIEQLARALEQQTRALTEAIPRQAAAMSEAAKQASAEVTEADAALEKRMYEMKNAGSTLAVRLIDLEAVGKDAMTRADALSESLARIEEKLSQSAKLVETAENASSIAVDAASGVSDALQDAVSSALDTARQANAEITESTRKLHEDAARLLSQVKLAVEDPSKVTVQPAVAPPPGRRLAEANGINGAHANGDGRPGPSLPLRGSTPARPLPPPTAPAAADEDLFDVEAEERAPRITQMNGDTNGSGNGATEWRDIIADISAETPESADDSPALPREETAETLITHLQSSGIPLPTAIKPRDKRKIAAAAKKDDKARRVAIRQVAGTEVDRVATRLRKDDTLMRLAQR
ncbi:MAG: hypothetical protein AAFQ84_04915, partial [Pseudomonadota bacterium]